jgi:hypothetical protein
MPKQLYNLPVQSTTDERFVQAMNWINVGASLVNCTSTIATRPLEMYAPPPVQKKYENASSQS